jgi:hypothetical protein
VRLEKLQFERQARQGRQGILFVPYKDAERRLDDEYAAPTKKSPGDLVARGGVAEPLA